VSALESKQPPSVPHSGWITHRPLPLTLGSCQQSDERPEDITNAAPAGASKSHSAPSMQCVDAWSSPLELPSTTMLEDVVVPLAEQPLAQSSAPYVAPPSDEYSIAPAHALVVGLVTRTPTMLRSTGQTEILCNVPMNFHPHTSPKLPPSEL